MRLTMKSKSDSFENHFWKESLFNHFFFQKLHKQSLFRTSLFRKNNLKVAFKSLFQKRNTFLNLRILKNHFFFSKSAQRITKKETRRNTCQKRAKRITFNHFFDFIVTCLEAIAYLRGRMCRAHHVQDVVVVERVRRNSRKNSLRNYLLAFLWNWKKKKKEVNL